MKTFYTTVLIILHVFGCISFAQVYTPFGTSVEYSIQSAGNVAEFENYAATYLSNRGWTNAVTKTGNATGEYNCHSYAWYKSEGGSNNYWINMYLSSEWNSLMASSFSSTPPSPNNLNKYWTDGSYIPVSESQATKVWFGSCWQWDSYVGEWVNLCDHSAVRLSSGLYESKWGRLPRYIHPADKCPYTLSNRVYYKRNYVTLTGPSHFNTSGVFTINGTIPSNATITPVQPSSNGSCLLATASGSNTITVSNNTGADWGFTTLSVIIEANGYSFTVTSSEFMYGEYIPESLEGYHYTNYGGSTGGWCNSDGERNYLYVDGLTEHQRYLLQQMQYQLRLISTGGGIYTIAGTISFSPFSNFEPVLTCNTTITMQIRNVSYNPNSDWHYLPFQISCNSCLPCSSCSSSSYSLGLTASPNPVSDVLSVSFDQETLAQAIARQQQASLSGSSVSSPASVTFDIRLYDSNGVLQRQTNTQGQGTTQLNVSNLPNGIYFLRVYSNLTPSQPEVHRIIIMH
jgi:hypothetical protein